MHFRVTLARVNCSICWREIESVALPAGTGARFLPGLPARVKSGSITAYLKEATERIIPEEVYGDATEANERTG